MRVLVIEANGFEDFYEGKLDGVAIHGVSPLLLNLRSVLRYALDKDHFYKAMQKAANEKFDVVHVSCHGNRNGIGMADGSSVNWNELAGCIPNELKYPYHLVLASCEGGAPGIIDAFKKIRNGPRTIFGSRNRLNYDDYLVAWTLLYRALDNEGVSKKVFQKALQQICAVVDDSFIYIRWDKSKRRYRTYPPGNTKYCIKRKEKN